MRIRNHNRMQQDINTLSANYNFRFTFKKRPSSVRVFLRIFIVLCTVSFIGGVFSGLTGLNSQQGLVSAHESVEQFNPVKFKFEEEIGVYIGKTVVNDNGLDCVAYFFRIGQPTVNIEGNYSLLLRIVIENHGTYFSKFEFDCSKKMVRKVAFGENPSKLTKRIENWYKVIPDSASSVLLEYVCNPKTIF